MLKNSEDESEEIKERIAGNSLSELAKKLIAFIDYKYTNPSRDEIKSVCKSALELFTTIGGMVSTYL